MTAVARDVTADPMRDLTICFARRHPTLGTFGLRRVDPGADGAVLHGWVTHPSCAFWEMQGCSLEETVAAYRDIDGSTTHDAFLGLRDGSAGFLAERYQPTHDAVGSVYAVAAGDVGMHFLSAPTDRPVHGFTRAAFATVMAFVLSDPAVDRVVVEPDAGNEAIHAMNAWAGFVPDREVALPGKTALLSFCTREQFLASEAGRLLS